ncbi:MAG: hypothetical protein IKT57_06245 [Clostridia bacterium]|nr:hypothetical protein [Clostridia bacterium]
MPDFQHSGYPSCRNPRQNDCCYHEQTRYLMQKVIASSHIHERCVCLSLCVEKLPCSVTAPFLLQAVQVCGQPQFLNEACGRSLLQIPLSLSIADACGHVFCTEGTLDYPLQLRSNYCKHDFAHIDATVSLLHPIKSENACFHGQFNILATIYFLKHTVVCSSGERFQPELPFYPGQGMCCKH